MNNNKNDSYFETDNSIILSKMKPIYGTDEQLNCGTITFGNKVYFIDYKNQRLIMFSSRDAMMATLYGDLAAWLKHQ